MEYLLKASAIIVIFYTCYKVCLQRDTFFEQNRWFLLAGLILALFIPLIVIPIYVETQPVDLNNLVFVENASTTNAPQPLFSFSALFNSVYFIGVLVFVFRFTLQITSLLPLIMDGKKQKVGRYNYIKTTKDVSPFSFFNLIVYNPKSFSDVELEQILTHEKAHVHQHHTLDVILSQLACIVFWFNPFIWLYNKDLKQNLEFIADKNAINNSNCKKSYQYTLLKTSMPTHQLALTNNFYTSLIKKRIVMLHKSKSKKINLLKYTLVIPVLALFLMSFNTKEVIIEKKLTSTNSNSFKELPVVNELSNALKPNTESQPIEKPVFNNLTSKTPERPSSSLEVVITKDYTDSDFEKLKTKFKNEGYTLKVKGVKRNNQNEITSIKIDVRSKSSNANYSVNTSDAIGPIKISIDDDGKNISIGNGHSKKDKHMVFVSKGDNKHVIKGSDDGSSVFVITDNDEDIEFDNDVNIQNFVVKKGDSIKIRKIHKKISSDDNNSGVSWTTDDDEKVIINGDDSDAKVKILSTGVKDPLFILDGKEITKDELKSINQNKIHSIYVLKDEQALKKYGNKGKEGVVVLRLKDKDTPNYITKIKGSALYIVDGKEITSKEMKDINLESIKSVDVLKGKSATKEYGDKGKNGVVIITLKKE